MANCSVCKSPIPDGLAACPNCGAALNTEVVEQGQPFQDQAYQEPQQPFQQARDFWQSQGQQPPQDYQQAGYQQQDYQQTQDYQQPTYATKPGIDFSSIAWGILGFLIPIVGLILYLAWRNSNPQRAKVVLAGAVVGGIFGLFTNLLSMMMSGTPTIAVG